MSVKVAEQLSEEMLLYRGLQYATIECKDFCGLFYSQQLGAGAASNPCGPLRSRGPKEGLWVGAAISMSQSPIS